eukprot:PhF_6_TR37616/c1_g3_i4/m.55905
MLLSFVFVFGVTFVCGQEKRILRHHEKKPFVMFTPSNAVCRSGTLMHAFSIFGPVVPGIILIGVPFASSSRALTTSYRFLTVLLRHFVQQTVHATFFRISESIDDTHAISVPIFMAAEAMWTLGEYM